MRRVGSLLLVSAIYALILTGCLSTPGIYLAEITSPRELNATANTGNVNLTDITIRFGYFGICTKSDGGFSCSSTHTAKKGNLTALQSDVLLKEVIDLQNSISYLIPVVALIFFVFGLITLFLWVLFTKRQQKFTIFDQATKVERKVKMLHTSTRALLWFSTALALTAAFSTTTTLLALRITSRIFSTENTRRKADCGTAIQVLQWAIFAISAIFSAYIQFWFQPSEAKDAAAFSNAQADAYEPDQMSESTPLVYPAATFAKPGTQVFPPPPRY